MRTALLGTAMVCGAIAAASAQQARAPQGAPAPGGGGPGGAISCHETRSALSRDGNTFTVEGLLLAKASVPDGIRLPDGSLGFYYVNAEDHGTYLARFDGRAWSRGERVLLDGAFNGNAVDPDAILLPDGRIRLYYFEGNFIAPNRAPGGVSALSPFYAAVSADGVRFTVEGKVFETAGGTDPSAVRLGDGSWLLVVARGMTQEMVVARSADGLQFAEVVTLKNGGIPELAVLDDGRVRLFFNGNGGMASRISADGGRTWTDERGSRLDYRGFAADPSVVRLPDGQWRMFFKTVDMDCEQARLAAVGPRGGPGQPPNGPPIPGTPQPGFQPGQQPLPPLPGGVQPKGGVPKGPPAP